MSRARAAPVAGADLARFLKNSHSVNRQITDRDSGVVVGRRTGVAMPLNVPLDANGFTDLDLYFGISTPSPTEMMRQLDTEEEDIFPGIGRLSINSVGSPVSAPGSPPAEMDKSDSSFHRDVSPVKVPTPLRPEVKQPEDDANAFGRSKKIARTPVKPVHPTIVAVTPPPKRTPTRKQSIAPPQPPTPPAEPEPEPEQSDHDDGADAGGDDMPQAASPLVEKPASARKVKKAAAVGKKKGTGIGRPSMLLVKVGEKAGLFHPPGASEAGEGQVRRTGRQRFAPLAYWKNQRLMFSRAGAIDPNQPPEVNIEETTQLIASLQSPPPVPKVARKKKDSADGDKKKKKTNKRKANDDGDDEEAPATGMEEKPVRIFLDPDQQQSAYAVVAKESQTLDYVPINEAAAGSESHLDAKHSGSTGSKKKAKSTPPAAAAAAGKSFDDPSFSAGTLRLPPGGSKPAEIATTSEMLFVTAGGANKLELRLNDQQMFLSPGAHLHIPTGNTYELINHDTKKTSVIQFVLVKATAPAAAAAAAPAPPQVVASPAAKAKSKSKSKSKKGAAAVAVDDDDE